MKDSHSIVLILGNGFDLDLGLKTSYKDFWVSEFCPKEYPAPLIHHLNNRWPDNKDAVKWYDLENELMEYYMSIPNPSNGKDYLSKDELEFMNDFQPYKFDYGMYNDKLDLIESLIDKGVILTSWTGVRKLHVNEAYIKDISQAPIWRDRKALQLIKNGLCRYLNDIKPPRNANSTIAFQVLNLLDEEANKGCTVNIYTFNYTRVQLNGKAPDNAQIHHMHGKCEDGRIIIGTRDDRNLNKEYDFLQKSFDSTYNPPALVEDLKGADEIVIFGHSIGENDRQYFKTFFKQQTDYSDIKRKDITIFTRDDNSEIQIKRSLQKMTDWNLSTLYGQNNIKIIKTGNIIDDQNLLYDFLIKHGKEKISTREFIGRLNKRDAET